MIVQLESKMNDNFKNKTIFLDDEKTIEICRSRTMNKRKEKSRKALIFDQHFLKTLFPLFLGDIYFFC